MSCLSVLVAANARVGYRNKAVVAVMLGFSAFFLAVFIALVCVLTLEPLTRSVNPDRDEISRYLSLLAYGSGFIAMGMNLIIFTANTLVKEKAQRLYESILAGPVGAGELWMAKSLAIFLPGLALCELAAIGTLLGVEALIVAPRMGFLASPAMLLNGTLLIPILYFPLTLIVILVGLVGNPISGNVIANVVFSALITLGINLVTRAGLDIGTPAFALASLAASLVLGLVVLALRPRLSKERIVLSCRS